MLLPVACTDSRTGEVMVALAQPRPSEARISPAPAAASSAAVTFARVAERPGLVAVEGAAPVTLPVAVMRAIFANGADGTWAGARIGARPDQSPGCAGRRLQGFEGVGGGDRAQHGHRLVAAFGVLGRRLGVGDDAGSGLDVRDAVAQQCSADRDGGVRVSGEVQVADTAAVQATPGRFQLVDDLHRPRL